MADKGTLFLDEVGELPLTMQTKLLRVLQDQEILRVGSTKVQKVDVRIIAATNRDLEEEVREGRFRSDLFYRLRVAVVLIPPLRERREDIAPMFEHFLRKYVTRYKKEIRVAPDVHNVFRRYHWPGNVRELENLIQSLIITSEDGLIEVSDLPSSMAGHLAEPCRRALTDLARDAGAGGPGADPRNLYQALDTGDRSLKEILAEIEREILRGGHRDSRFHHRGGAAFRHRSVHHIPQAAPDADRRGRRKRKQISPLAGRAAIFGPSPRKAL